MMESDLGTKNKISDAWTPEVRLVSRSQLAAIHGVQRLLHETVEVAPVTVAKNMLGLLF